MIYPHTHTHTHTADSPFTEYQPTTATLPTVGRTVFFHRTQDDLVRTLAAIAWHSCRTTETVLCLPEPRDDRCQLAIVRNRVSKYIPPHFISHQPHFDAFWRAEIGLGDGLGG